MQNIFFRKLKKLATGWLVGASFLLYTFFLAYIIPPGINSIKNETGALKQLDLMLFYTPQTAYDMIASLGDTVRSIYLSLELSTDMAFPLVYTIFFTLLITWLLSFSFPNKDELLTLSLLPFGAALFDILENLGIAAMLWRYPSRPDILAWVTAIFTMAKWMFTAAVAVVIFSCIMAYILKKLQRKKHHRAGPHIDRDGELKF